MGLGMELKLKAEGGSMWKVIKAAQCCVLVYKWPRKWGVAWRGVAWRGLL